MNELINNPEQCRQHLIEFLSSYWESCIAPEWPSLQTQLWEDISRRGRALARRGLPLMLAELAHTVRVDDSTGNVLFLAPGERRDTEEIDLALSENDQILLVPSHFVWPELTTIVQKDNRKGREQTTLLITYATATMQHQGHAPKPPEDLLKLLRAVADPTRMQILRLLARRCHAQRGRSPG